MARKKVFIGNKDGFFEDEVVYKFYPGFAVSQKQKNVDSIEAAIKFKNPHANVLEVSSKSRNKLGIELSAFNLKLGNIAVESIYQSSKVFVDGRQFSFLITYKPALAKKYVRENGSGAIKCFRYENKEYPINPQSAFYDYLYILALKENEVLSEQLLKYDTFTDVEFNSAKSIACQARTCAIFVYLKKCGMLDECLKSFDNFIKIYDFDKTIRTFHN